MPPSSGRGYASPSKHLRQRSFDRGHTPESRSLFGKTGADSARSHRCRMRSTDVAPVTCRSNRGSFPGTGTRDIPERKQTQAQRRQVRPMRLPQVLHNQIKDWQIRLTLSARKRVRHMLPHLDRHSIDGAVARRSFTKSHFDCSRTCRCRRRTIRARGIHLGPGR